MYWISGTQCRGKVQARYGLELEQCGCCSEELSPRHAGSDERDNGGAAERDMGDYDAA